MENYGNDQADAIANTYRQQGELCEPQPYFTLAEEKIIFQHNGIHIQGDAREALKSLERQKLLETWLAKTKVQSQWIKKYPTQILKQAKRVWGAAILRGDGRAWVYFIFAACQWLPTNDCLYRKIPNFEEKVVVFFAQGERQKQLITSLSVRHLRLL